MKTIKPTEENVKHIGRTLYQNGILWLALSGTGIEFTFEGRHLDILLQGDDHTAADADQARIAVYIDDECILDEMIREAHPCYTVIEEGEARRCTVRLLKLSEAPMSIAGVRELTADDDAVIHPAPAKARRIEFIGDSITCGYGTDDTDLTHTFSTETENVTEAYAYRTARLLDADYSMVSYSGYGIYSGYVDESSDVRNTSELVPPYYGLVGFSRGTYEGKPVTVTEWDFKKYVPDVIVLNLGTNDNSYCRSLPDRESIFMSCYRDFIAAVRSRNPRAYILCIYGIMNCELRTCMETVLRRYREETGDCNISFLAMPTQTEADGYVVDYHPSIATHIRAAGILADEIRRIWKR